MNKENCALKLVDEVILYYYARSKKSQISKKRNCMSAMCLCSATDRHIGSDWVWKSSKTTEILLKKTVFHTNLEHMFKRTTTDLDTLPTLTQQRLMCAHDNTRLLPDCCCYLSDTGNKMLFRINIASPLTTIAGLDRASQWLGLPGHRTSHQRTSSYGSHI